MVVNNRFGRALWAGPRVAVVLSVLLIVAAGVRSRVRHASSESLRQQLSDAEATLQRLRSAEANLIELKREESRFNGQLAELETILHADEASIARDLERDLWASGFAVTSITRLRTSQREDVVEHRFQAAAHAGRRTWLEALDVLSWAHRIYDVDTIRVVDPADPDARVELEIVTRTHPRPSGNH